MVAMPWWPFSKTRYLYQNTRQYPRLPASWPVKCEPTQEAPRLPLVTRTKDISAGGVAVVVREAMPVSTRIHLEIFVPTLNRILSMEAEVVRCRPLQRGTFELGVRFIQIDPTDRQQLQQAVEKALSPKRHARHLGSWWRRVE